MFIRVCLCVILCVCVFVRMTEPKTAETTITKLATGIVHHESGYPFNIRSKGQRSRSQGHKVQKHLLDDQAASMSLRLYRASTSSSSYHYILLLDEVPGMV